MSRRKSLMRQQTNSVCLCVVWQALPGRHLVGAVLTSRPLPLFPHCWWWFQDHPADCPVGHNYPPTGSTPAAGPNINPLINFNIWFVSTNTPIQDNFHKKVFHKKIHFCLCMNSYGPQQMCTTNLDPPLRSHFLFQSLLLQSFGSDFQLDPLILLTLECFWLTLEQMLHKGQLGSEDLQELLDHQETRFVTEVR